jgi:hypothetical protein
MVTVVRESHAVRSRSREPMRDPSQHRSGTTRATCRDVNRSLGLAFSLLAVFFAFTGCNHPCDTPATPTLMFSKEASHLKATVSNDGSGITLSFIYEENDVCPIFQGSATADGVRMNFADGEQGLGAPIYTGDGSSGECNVEYTCGKTEFTLPSSAISSHDDSAALDIVVTDSGGSEHIAFDGELAVTQCDFDSCSYSE